MRTTRFISALVAVPAAAVCLAATPASAAAPDHSRAYVDDTKTFGAGGLCDFAIVRHMWGWHTDTVTTMQNGVQRDHAFVEDFTYELSNPANGKSVSGKEGGQFTVYTEADGTVTYVITGNDGLFTLAHQGFVAAQAGRYVEVDYPDGSYSIEASTGHFAVGFAPGVCDALR